MPLIKAQHLIANVLCASMLVWSLPAHAVEWTYKCTEVRGTGVYAPSWEPVDDGFSEESFLLLFDTEGPSYVDGNQGIGRLIAGGFAIFIVLDVITETYVVNVVNQELMMTRIRSTNKKRSPETTSFIPNAASAYRGTCEAVSW
jgi:hypothetical protein